MISPYNVKALEDRSARQLLKGVFVEDGVGYGSYLWKYLESGGKNYMG
jgi:hypothetical protein